MNENLLIVMTVAVSLSALAMIGQAIGLILIAMAANKIKDRVEEFSPKAEAILETAEKTLVNTRTQIDEVTTKANLVIDTTKARVESTDEFLSEVTERARVQLDRVELVLDDSIGRIHETVVLLNNGVLRPVRELSGIATGIRTAFQFLLGGGKPDISKATTDEEMFI